MRFGPTAVAQALALLEPGVATPDAAARLATLTGSWEELLAHLLLRRDGFAGGPEIAAAIRDQAEAYRGGPATPRTEGADLLLMEQTAAALEEALGAVLAAEAEHVAIADRAAAAWQAHAAARPATEGDLRLRIGPPRR